MHMIGPRVSDPQLPASKPAMMLNCFRDNSTMVLIQQHDRMQQSLTPPICQQWLWVFMSASVSSPSAFIALQPCAVDCPRYEVGEWIIIHNANEYIISRNR